MSAADPSRHGLTPPTHPLARHCRRPTLSAPRTATASASWSPTCGAPWAPARPPSVRAGCARSPLQAPALCAAPPPTCVISQVGANAVHRCQTAVAWAGWRQHPATPCVRANTLAALPFTHRPAEACDGTSTVCPADDKQPTSQLCRPAAGPCDVDGKSLERGTAAAPPLPALVSGPPAAGCSRCLPARAPSLQTIATARTMPALPTSSSLPATCAARPRAPATSTVRRSAAGRKQAPVGPRAACTYAALPAENLCCRLLTPPSRLPAMLADRCDGRNNACPDDDKRPTTHVCRPAAGPCDVDGAMLSCRAEAVHQRCPTLPAPLHPPTLLADVALPLAFPARRPLRRAEQRVPCR